jgi:hypothetical protein
MIYLMSPDLYNTLTMVSGFTNRNGNTYQEHIIKTLNNQINKDIKEEIIKTTTSKDALNILENNNIEYTHNYNNV